MRAKLELQWQSTEFSDKELEEQRKAFFNQLELAWDVLTYDRYTAGTRHEHLAAQYLFSFHQECARERRNSVIILNQKQSQMIDALAEAAGVPHHKGQKEFPVPEKLKDYNHYQLSEEYQARWYAARNRGQ